MDVPVLTYAACVGFALGCLTWSLGAIWIRRANRVVPITTLNNVVIYREHSF